MDYQNQKDIWAQLGLKFSAMTILSQMLPFGGIIRTMISLASTTIILSKDEMSLIKDLVITCVEQAKQNWQTMKLKWNEAKRAYAEGMHENDESLEEEYIDETENRANHIDSDNEKDVGVRHQMQNGVIEVVVSFSKEEAGKEFWLSLADLMLSICKVLPQICAFKMMLLASDICSFVNDQSKFAKYMNEIRKPIRIMDNTLRFEINLMKDYCRDALTAWYWGLSEAELITMKKEKRKAAKNQKPNTAYQSSSKPPKAMPIIFNKKFLSAGHGANMTILIDADVCRGQNIRRLLWHLHMLQTFDKMYVVLDYIMKRIKYPDNREFLYSYAQTWIQLINKGEYQTE